MKHYCKFASRLLFNNEFSMTKKRRGEAIETSGTSVSRAVNCSCNRIIAYSLHITLKSIPMKQLIQPSAHKSENVQTNILRMFEGTCVKNSRGKH